MATLEPIGVIENAKPGKAPYKRISPSPLKSIACL